MMHSLTAGFFARLQNTILHCPTMGFSTSKERDRAEIIKRKVIMWDASVARRDKMCELRI